MILAIETIIVKQDIPHKDCTLKSDLKSVLAPIPRYFKYMNSAKIYLTSNYHHVKFSEGTILEQERQDKIGDYSFNIREDIKIWEKFAKTTLVWDPETSYHIVNSDKGPSDNILISDGDNALNGSVKATMNEKTLVRFIQVDGALIERIIENVKVFQKKRISWFP